MKADPRWVRDSLVKDFANSQPEGSEFDVVAAEGFIVDVLEKLERKQADRTPTTPGTPGVVDEDPVRTEYEKRTGRAMSASIDRNVRTSPLVSMSEVERVGRARLQQRMAWIGERPDLMRRMKSYAAGLLSNNKSKREQAAMKMRELIEETNRLAGHDWRKPKPQKLVFSG